MIRLFMWLNRIQLGYIKESLIGEIPLLRVYISVLYRFNIQILTIILFIEYNG